MVVLLAACEAQGPKGLAPEANRGLDRGREAAARWIATGRGVDAPPDPAVLALGYLERLRLGLGSPFRLAEQALVDLRLPATDRTSLAWAILARTYDRESHEIEAAALDRIGSAPGAPARFAGALHLDLISGAIRESLDPRSGELAVRLAYALAAGEGTVERNAPEIATRAAALLRDRELARADVVQLLRAADRDNIDPLVLLVRWRAERRFAVEAPPLMPIAPEAELHAIELAPRLARGVREVGLRTVTGAVPRPLATLPLLGVAAAERLSALTDALDMPPQAPIAVTVGTHRRDLLANSNLTPSDRSATERFLRRATSEERFAAEYALLQRRSGGRSATALTALGSAVAMRAYAQEPVWFPGFGGPSSRELEERYGLAAVNFGRTVPVAWRPYYRRMLDIALEDMRRVLPALDLRGLTVDIDGDLRLRGSTLALHDPRSRRVILPPGSAAGTLAHEIAHDLDWQVALRRYRVRGDYASDRAERAPRDRLAARLNELAAASLDPVSFDDRGSRHESRPAEIFARNIDWFVAVSLAADGRSNGYLTSIQDDVLTGYGTARAPDVSGAAGETLVSILDEVAPLYPATREWFLKSYGLSRALTPHDLARRVLDAHLEQAGEDPALHGPVAAVTLAARRLGPVEKAREAGFAAIDTWICRAPGAAYNPRLEAARRQLVVEAAAARVRGTALEYARSVAGEPGRRHTARALFGPGWPGAVVDSSTAALLEPLPTLAVAIGAGRITTPPRRIDLVGPPDRCATAPFRLAPR
jgi:hypothetical protein